MLQKIIDHTHTPFSEELPKAVFTVASPAGGDRLGERRASYADHGPDALSAPLCAPPSVPVDHQNRSRHVPARPCEVTQAHATSSGWPFIRAAGYACGRFAGVGNAARSVSPRRLSSETAWGRYRLRRDCTIDPYVVGGELTASARVMA